MARSAAARARRRGSSGAVRRAGPRGEGYGLGLWARCPWARTPAPGSHLSSSTGVYTIGARLPLGMPRQQIRFGLGPRRHAVPLSSLPCPFPFFLPPPLPPSLSRVVPPFFLFTLQFSPFALPRNAVRARQSLAFVILLSLLSLSFLPYPSPPPYPHPQVRERYVLRMSPSIRAPPSFNAFGLTALSPCSRVSMYCMMFGVLCCLLRFFCLTAVLFSVSAPVSSRFSPLSDPFACGVLVTHAAKVPCTFGLCCTLGA